MSLTNNKQALFGNSKGNSNQNATSSTAISSGSTAAPVPVPQSKTAGMSLSSATKSTGPVMSAEARQKKMNEAHEYYVKAEENLKTSFFQWKPDHLSAASNFEKCGDLYKAADQPKKAIKAYLLSADNYESCNTLASAALNRGKAAEVAKEIDDHVRCAELLQLTAETWGLHGDVQKYGETLEKVAKEFELLDVNKAKETHLKAIEVLCPSSTPKEQLGQTHPVIIDIVKGVFSFLVKNKFYSEALKLSERMVEIFTAFDLESGICKSLAAITILQIAQGDVVKAQQIYLQEHLNIAVYMRSQECDFIDVLILACTNQDDDLMDKAKMHPQLNYLDKELQHIVKNLSLFELLESGGGGGKTTESSVPATSNSKGSLFAKKKEIKQKEAEKEEDHQAISEAVDTQQLHNDLNNLNIPDFNDFNENEEEEVSEPVTRPKEEPPVATSTATVFSPEEDEDDIDLS